MDELKLVLNAKNVRKVAFVVGFGLTFGETVGTYAGAAIGGVITGTIKAFAKHGNEFAQEVCDGAKIKYETKEEKNDDEPKMKCGFHC